MSRIKKFLLILLCIPILVLFAITLYRNQTYVNLGWLGDYLNKQFAFGYYYHQAIFWLSLVLTIATIILLIAIIFYPRDYSEIVLSDANGVLAVKKSAIESHVKSTIAASSYMASPKVNVKLTKKKCEVSVKGDVSQGVDIVNRTNALQKEIISGLNSFLGLDHNIYLNVKVLNTAVEQHKPKQKEAEAEAIEAQPEQSRVK